MSKSFPNWEDLNKNCLDKTTNDFDGESLLENGLEFPDNLEVASSSSQNTKSTTELIWTRGNRISDIENPEFPGQTSLKSDGINVRLCYLPIIFLTCLLGIIS